MKIYDFSQIALGMEMSPDTAKFIQEGMLDRFESLLKALTGSSTDIVVLHGCEWDHVGTNYSLTEGVVYYNGKIRIVPAFTGVSVAGTVPVWLTETVQSEPKARFADSTFKFVFSSEKMKLEMDVAGSGIADWDQTITFEIAIKNMLGINYGEWIPLTLINGWTNNASVEPAAYKIEGDKIVFRGKIYVVAPGSPNTFCVLPIDIQPLVEKGFVACSDVTTANSFITVSVQRKGIGANSGKFSVCPFAGVTAGSLTVVDLTNFSYTL